jgi:GNAT superfamily N-acetyltransferase
MASVRLADAGDVPALSAALAQAFTDDSMVNWMLPQRIRRVARLELMFGVEVEAYALPQHGLVVTADDGRGGLAGGCVTLPPGGWRMPSTIEGRTALRWLRAFGRRMPAMVRLQRAMEAHHPEEPHHYVRWVGVRPGFQGQGLGRALMRPTLERCDREHVAAYIEASSERSAALYARLGFAHLGAMELPDGGPTVWPMRRPAHD